MRRRRPRTEREPTIALINIVFLMLTFFLVAGTLARPLDPGLALVRTGELDGAVPPDALVIHPDGGLAYAGTEIGSVAEYLAAREAGAEGAGRIVPDRDLPAETLVRIAAELRAAGAGRIVIVTERGMR
ncbi:MAG: ExbD/TolR family protein [Paracoccaceae bacterium]